MGRLNFLSQMMRILHSDSLAVVNTLPTTPVPHIIDRPESRFPKYAYSLRPRICYFIKQIAPLRWWPFCFAYSGKMKIACHMHIAIYGWLSAYNTYIPYTSKNWVVNIIISPYLRNVTFRLVRLRRQCYEDRRNNYIHNSVSAH